MSPRLKARRGRFGPGGILPPQVTIATVQVVAAGSPAVYTLNATGVATDDLQGDISSSIAWSSDVDGALGTGASISVVLTAGAHVITASVTDGATVVTDTANVNAA